MSSTAGTPPSPMTTLPQLSPGLEQPKGGILLHPDLPSRPTISIPATSPSVSSSKSPGGSQRIRFAPLPDPRPRSLSTGQNIGWTSAVDEDGNEVRHMEVRNIPQTQVNYDTDDAITDDEGDEHRMRGRSWSKGMESSLAKGMESSWKMSKKILTAGMWDDKEDKKYEGGMPLKKSQSAGMIGSSPFKWSDPKRAALPVPTSPGHRRMSSLEPDTTSAALGSSPQPVKVKLLNGRVYGARRASEIAEMQKKQREASEPAFVEWGTPKPAVSTAAPVKSSGFLGDNDDGSGMEWVKRRREERQKKEREERERKEREESSPEVEKVETPASQPVELPTTPVIHISEPSQGDVPMKNPEPDSVFEEDDDGDFSSDDEEEEEIDRTTSSAAGIEIMSRHHH